MFSVLEMIWSSAYNQIIDLLSSSAVVFQVICVAALGIDLLLTAVGPFVRFKAQLYIMQQKKISTQTDNDVTTLSLSRAGYHLHRDTHTCSTKPVTVMNPFDMQIILKCCNVMRKCDKCNVTDRKPTAAKQMETETVASVRRKVEMNLILWVQLLFRIFLPLLMSFFC